MKKSVVELNLKYKKLEGDLLNLKTGEPNSNGGDNSGNSSDGILSVFLSYNLLFKLFIIILFVLIVKHNLSTELLLAVITISILLILFKTFFLTQKPFPPPQERRIAAWFCCI